MDVSDQTIEKIEMEFFCRYFETYSMLTNVSNQRRIQTDVQMAKANGTAETGKKDFLDLKKTSFCEFIERLKDSRKVDSLAFILLLFLQSFHQIDLKSTLSRDEFVDFINRIIQFLMRYLDGQVENGTQI